VYHKLPPFDGVRAPFSFMIPYPQPKENMNKYACDGSFSLFLPRNQENPLIEKNIRRIRLSDPHNFPLDIPYIFLYN
jgi:hypothetical protein